MLRGSKKYLAASDRLYTRYSVPVSFRSFSPRLIRFTLADVISSYSAHYFYRTFCDYIIRVTRNILKFHQLCNAIWLPRLRWKKFETRIRTRAYVHIARYFMQTFSSFLKRNPLYLVATTRIRTLIFKSRN